MQYCSADIALYGQEGAVIVPKEDLSIPEIALMRALHGEDGVRNIQPTRVTTEAMVSFKAKLVEKFKSSPETLKVMDKLWPGMSPLLPKSLEDIGLTFDPATLGSKEKAARPVTAADLGVEDDPEAEHDDGSAYGEPETAEAVGARLARETAGAGKKK
jgi:hypothetical protein